MVTLQVLVALGVILVVLEVVLEAIPEVILEVILEILEFSSSSPSPPSTGPCTPFLKRRLPILGSVLACRKQHVVCSEGILT